MIFPSKPSSFTRIGHRAVTLWRHAGTQVQAKSENRDDLSNFL